jgi:hypothetical protein
VGEICSFELSLGKDLVGRLEFTMLQLFGASYSIWQSTSLSNKKNFVFIYGIGYA